MELREYWNILWRGRRWFVLSVVVCVLVSSFFVVVQKPKVGASVLLNIARSGTDAATDYKYDSFYRLQADERFADTVVAWLGTPRVVADIATGAKGNGVLVNAGNPFGAKRLSSDAIVVTYAAGDEGTLRRTAGAMTAVLGRLTDSLNTNGKETMWFTLVVSDPVMYDARVGMGLAVGVGAVIGIFCGVWLVYVRHYFGKE